MVWRQMVLVIEKRIPCGGCREEDSPITIWKEGFKRKGGRGMKESVSGSSSWGQQAVQFEVRTERTDRYCAFFRQFGGYVRVTLVNVRGAV
jgi:hypothetical protein